MKQPLISIVVPVYNVERYLNRCMDSIVNQTYKNIEIILVDDGSLDSSGEICDDWSRKDNRVKVIHKQNEGLGLARNTGIDNSTGEYITFVDSDDFLDNSVIAHLCNEIVEKDAQVAYCGFNTYTHDGKVILQDSNYSKISTGKEVLLEIIGSHPNAIKDVGKSMSVCAALFKRSIIYENNIRFSSERTFISEDLLFDIMILPLIDRVVFTDFYGYYYCENEGSLTRRYVIDRISKEIKLFNEVNKRLELLFSENEYRYRLNRFFLGRIRTCIVQVVMYSPENISMKLKEIKEIASNQLVKEIITTYPIELGPWKQRLFNYCLKNNYTYAIYLMVKIHKL